MNENLHRKKSWRGSALLIVVIVVIVVLYLGYRAYESKHNATAVREETLERAIPAVTVLYPQELEANQTIDLPGNFVAWHQAPIYARISGYVDMWYSDYGAKVKKGDLLAELNTPMVNAEYRMAEAEVKAKEAEYKLAVVTKGRWVNLGDTKAVSTQSVSVKTANERVKNAELNRAKQELKNIEAKRSFRHILAPFDGVVIERNVNVGDYVNETGSLSLKGEEQANMFTVADTSKMRLFVSVPESFGPFLKPGLTADVTVPQFPKRHFTANFLTVAGGFDVSTRTAVTEFIIENEDGVLWPGSYASVRITAPVERGAVSIPTTSLVFEEEGATAAIVTADNRIHFKPIEVRRIRARTLEVAGISTTDRLVDNPSAALLEGDEVRIIDKPAKGYIKSPYETTDSDLPTQKTASKTSSPETGAQPPQEAAGKQDTDNRTLPYKVGPYQFDVALKPNKPVVGKNILVIYLRDQQGRPIQNAAIEAVAKITTEDSQKPTEIPAEVREVKPGIYGGSLDLPKAGDWSLTLWFETAGTPKQKAVLDMTSGRHGELAMRDNP
ncbi:efflux RND transporter periplasmic adaptor subunit [Nitrosococcus watsonii]|uniref:Efflux transporter, RND family, MFP subunit n=1 Tax=Nitrosococcus watsoni (strain C-113) TaxID=105559 RepID=D8K5C2_NITWC|nr:efflux RND transporter periplasmic adaptor subunit [Nitrosococcus watsonii]ADJ28099.1 efflux transporter, RND family, MFP subunit [Nitrosococcus watsonii C-113]